MPFLFRKLDVYRRSIDIADRVDRIASSVKRGHRHLADQLSRASISVPANIAESDGRFTPGERIHFFAIARGSAYECACPQCPSSQATEPLIDDDEASTRSLR